MPLEENIFLSKRAPKACSSLTAAPDLESKLESLKDQSTNILPKALSTLSKKARQIDEVVSHCTDSFIVATTQQEKDALERQTREYMRDVMDAVAVDVRDLTDKVGAFADLQLDVLEGHLMKRMDGVQKGMEEVRRRRFE